MRCLFGIWSGRCSSPSSWSRTRCGGDLVHQGQRHRHERKEVIDNLVNTVRSGTKKSRETCCLATGAEDAQLIGQFGVGFYSAFMVAKKVTVLTKRGDLARGALGSGRRRPVPDPCCRQSGTPAPK